MSRSSGLGSHRFLLALIALPVLGLGFVPAAATAGTISTDCAALQSTINTVATVPAYGLGCPLQSATPAPGLTHYISRKVSPTGIAVKLSCSSTDGLGCSGTIFLTTNEILQGKKVIAVGASHRARGSVRLGQASFALAAGATATFTVKLNSTGLQLLRHFHAISAFVLANEASPTSAPFIFLLDGVRFSEPKKHGSKQHKHKQRHPKPRH